MTRPATTNYIIEPRVFTRVPLQELFNTNFLNENSCSRHDSPSHNRKPPSSSAIYKINIKTT